MLQRPTTDGVVVIRPPEAGDAAVLIAGRDEEFHRFLGPGSDDPRPTGCVVVGGEVIGWVDVDIDRSWLQPGEVNVGYSVVAGHRGLGYASRAVKLLLHHLALAGDHHTATLLIHPDNARSLALAERTGFSSHGELDGNPYWKRPVPPLSYSDGTVTIRRRHREQWEAMAPHEQRAHARRGLREDHDGFGTGPKWTFTIDAGATRGVGYVDCDLANDHVPHGDANVSYAAHPAHRGHGLVSRAVRLIARFLADHTGTRTAHVITDQENTASLRVARSVGAQPREQWTDELGHDDQTHIRDLTAPKVPRRRDRHLSPPISRPPIRGSTPPWRHRSARREGQRRYRSGACVARQ